MSEWETPEERNERRRRVARTTFDQRLSWLDGALELARETGALDRARQRKRENTWKYGKQ